MQSNELEIAVKTLSANDKVMLRIIKKNGKINLTEYTNYYSFLISSIIGQQLSTSAADAIHKKFSSKFGENPTAEKIVRVRDITLRKLGISNAKVKYVKDLSQKLISEEISLKNIEQKSDEDIISELTKVKGIGIWTVHMFLIFALGRFNVLPYTDLGIRKSIMVNYSLKSLPDEKEIKSISLKNKWSPYNSVASLYLWKSLDNN
ncbi:MAG: hypothetical protein K8F36_13580 [Melioribacteraceae bacterium]|nr:hypothetical protein [Melioribacteraceae bacterium]MCO6472560.1 DNA-3-methyladenine glycosylase 2 family protein [Melioribacteraceae bacterium]MDD3558345.1 hypothetical protein [Melioribacteraceae bacterium]